jgi:hypothetical protein
MAEFVSPENKNNKKEKKRAAVWLVFSTDLYSRTISAVAHKNVLITAR